MLEVDECAIGPEPPAQFVPGDHGAGTLEHHAQDFERLLLQADRAAAAGPELARPDVQLERPEAQRPVGVHQGFHDRVFNDAATVPVLKVGNAMFVTQYRLTGAIQQLRVGFATSLG